MTQDRTIKILLLFCATILILGAAYLAQPIVAPVAFSLFIIAIVWPIQQALQARLPKLLALTITVLGVVVVLSVLGLLLIWGFSRVVQWLTSNADRLQVLYGRGVDWLDGHGVSVASVVNPGKGNTNWILPAVRDIGGRGYRLISFIVIAFAFTVLGLLEVDVVRKNIERLESAATRQMLLVAGADIAAKLQKYMVVRSVMSVLTGVVVWSFALLAGIELATAWGVIAFVLNYIPFVGPLFATVFPTLFALVQFESWQLAVAIFACLNLVQFLIGSYLEPRMAGAALSISPFIVLSAVFLGSFLWGVAGAFMGVPIVIALLAVCDEYESTRWIAQLLSGRERKRA
ncbi:AI-2E family transporter [Bradyrhizobium lablabi]|uniref:AI-2E family transporter n=1 Tax=Bradyrhizobium lablabi TaxID=722472 RepID=UPI001BA628FE|nr:AI-2E family transporter [Bradyrhizobium lablabi]MBR0695533.1 AI-2E family transporter [Bradyrhizobium lablabi]